MLQVKPKAGSEKLFHARMLELLPHLPARFNIKAPGKLSQVVNNVFSYHFESHRLLVIMLGNVDTFYVTRTWQSFSLVVTLLK